MAATAATSFSLSSSSSSVAVPKLLKPSALNLGFLGSSSSNTALNSLKVRAFPSRATNNGGSALSTQMVSAPSSINPPSSATFDFESSIFNKEKITLSGHDEVFLSFDFAFAFALVILILLFFWYTVLSYDSILFVDSTL